MRLRNGEVAPDFDVTDVFGVRHRLSELAGRKVMISFYRHSGCPFCNLRVREMIRLWPEISARGPVYLSFWKSEQSDILKEVGSQRPQFAMIADPLKLVYHRYRVENSNAAMWRMAAEAKLVYEALRSPFTKFNSKSESSPVPADFLLNDDLTIAAAYYGQHIGDHLPISDIRRWLDLGVH